MMSAGGAVCTSSSEERVFTNRTRTAPFRARTDHPAVLSHPSDRARGSPAGTKAKARPLPRTRGSPALYGPFRSPFRARARITRSMKPGRSGPPSAHARITRLPLPFPSASPPPSAHARITPACGYGDRKRETPFRARADHPVAGLEPLSHQSPLPRTRGSPVLVEVVDGQPPPSAHARITPVPSPPSLSAPPPFRARADHPVAAPSSSPRIPPLPRTRGSPHPTTPFRAHAERSTLPHARGLPFEPFQSTTITAQDRR